MQPLSIRQFDSPSVGPLTDNDDDDERQTLFRHHHHSRHDGNNDTAHHVALVFAGDSMMDAATTLAHEPRQLFGDEEQEVAVGEETENDETNQSVCCVELRQACCACLDRKSSSSDSEVCCLQGQSDFWSILKYSLSVGLLLFSVFVVSAAVVTGQTKTTASPVFVLLVVCSLIFWLGMMEGGQGCLVGLQPVDQTLYASSHPVALQCTRLAHKGDNMNRFIVGRQFLVVLVVFVINLCSSVVPETVIDGLNHTTVTLFLRSGLATILLTVVLGQLTAQVNAAHCMLDFINTSFMLFTTYVSLAIEWSGLLHAVYLVQYLFAVYTGKPVASAEPPRTALANISFWTRVVISFVLLSAALWVTVVAIFHGQTTMFEGVPKVVSLVLFLVLMCAVGLMEGMQIAVFAVVNLPERELQQHPVAKANCDFVFEGSNFARYLIGRQICVTLCMFVVARITTIAVDTDDGDLATVMGVSQGMQKFLNTGLPGALVTTIVASLAWRIIASAFPIAFMSNPVVYWTIRLCLALEASGICSAAWLLAAIQKYIVGFQPDEIHLGANTMNKSRVEQDLEVDDTASEVSSEDSKFADYGATTPVFERSSAGRA